MRICYHDTVLEESDTALLSDGCWLNDAVISFAYDRLGHEMFADSPFAFLPPSGTQLQRAWPH